MTRPDVLLRSARPEDLAIIYDMGQPEFQDPTRYDWGFSPEALSALCDPQYGFMYVAELEGPIIGFLCGTWSFPECSAVQCRVLWMYVVPAMRNQGVATELIRTAAREAECRGKTSMCIAVFEQNETARVLVKRLGFVRQDALVFHQAALTDIWLTGLSPLAPPFPRE